MGYEVEYSGTIKLTDSTRETEFKNLLGQEFEDELNSDCYFGNDNDGTLYGNISGSGKYWEEPWLKQLDKIKAFSEGSIEFVGEDNSLWRFNIKNNQVSEHSGEVYYGDVITHILECQGEQLPEQLKLDLKKWRGTKEL